MFKNLCAKLYYEQDKPKRIDGNKDNEGFISTLVFSVIHLLWCLSLIEIFKGIAVSRSPSTERKSRANAIDFHTVLKWVIVLFFLVYPRGLAWKVGVGTLAYFLFMNLFSYFYYHLWKYEPPTEIASKPDVFHARTNRRFILFALSFLYSIVGFAAFFRGPWGAELRLFDRSMENAPITDALAASVANAFTFTPGQFVPASHFGYALLTTQVFYSFVFLVVILVVSLPPKS
ncbi:hypothetical protein EU803_15390 [Loktanella sp. IMCC34160]|uniref:hypothetical protein n=1 Tax=Loktanella sp. IMCC34160 TaxID=2510646 RepID=UPI00101BD1D0|nr:hypothetical protein [Loktanella sp. IMCC34160]RYG89999.1 hypothetical protein EU803_15390 [Loktanella sp. IMCC34160]